MILDINQTTSIPRARPGESPGSILLRYSGAHFEQPIHILKLYGFPARDLASLLSKCYRGDTEILDNVADLSNWHQSAFLVSLAVSRNNRNWFNSRSAKVCPICAEEGYLPAIHDLLCVNTCTRHKLQLLTRCQTCSQRITWSRPNLNHCKCFEALTERKPASTEDIEYCEAIEELVSEQDSNGLSRLTRLTSLLEDRYGLNHAKTVALALIKKESKPLSLALAGFQRYHSALPHAVILAPLVKMLGNMGYVPADIMREIVHSHKSVTPRPLPEGFALTNYEMRFALGCTPKSMEALREQYFSSKAIDRGKFQFALSEIEAVFGVLTQSSAVSTDEPSTSLRELHARTGRPIADWVDDILNGKYNVTSGLKDLNGLSDICINHCPARDESVPSSTMTHKQATSYCGLYGAALTSAREAKLISALPQRQQFNRYLYRCADLDVFRKKYVTAGMLSKGLKTSEKVLKAKLKYVGILPVSGPQTDGTTIYFFATEDVKDVSISQLQVITQNYSDTGRKSGPKSDASATAVIASYVEKALGFPQQQLKYLTRITPLVEVEPDDNGVATQRHFDKSSVLKAKLYIDRLIPISTLSEKSGLSRLKLIRRVNLLLKDAIITLHDHQFLEPENADHVLRHCATYWCAEAAAAYLQCSRHNIHNWRKHGHLNALPASDTDAVQNLLLFHRSDVEMFTPPIQSRQTLATNKPARGLPNNDLVEAK